MFSMFIYGCSSKKDETSYFNKGISKYKKGNYKKAAEFFEKACNMKNIKGCYRLIILYIKGQGIKQSYTHAAKLYKKACKI
jgi:TPR repeat protein